MEVTLKLLGHAKGYTEFELLKLKKELLSYKKSGMLFFEEDVHQLHPESPFQLYYCKVPNESSLVNAFPVPLAEFYLMRSARDRLERLQEHFASYYTQAAALDVDFSLYDAQLPYIGKEFAWYYKRTAVFS